jgi:hypothetical protein
MLFQNNMTKNLKSQITVSNTHVIAVGHGIGGIDIPAKMARLAKSLSQE